jgi:hypothetical protein
MIVARIARALRKGRSHDDDRERQGWCGVTTTGTRDGRQATSAFDSRSVRSWLAVDALLCGVNGLGYLLLTGPLVALLGSDPSTLRIIGVYLLAFSAATAAAARSADPVGPATRSIVVANAAWIIASVAVVIADPLDLRTAGRSWVLLQAAVVSVVAVLQSRTGWRR